MNNVWILVCNAANARIFERAGRERAWRLLDVRSHEESRAKASELASDHSGARAPEGGSAHRNALAPASSPKEVEKDHFAHSLAETLDQAQRSARFRKWVLVAPPGFVGRIKKELTPELEKRLMATVDKDLSQQGVRELEERLGDIARIPVNELDAIREPYKQSH